MANAIDKKELKREIKKAYKNISSAVEYLRTLDKNDIAGRMDTMDTLEWDWYELGELCKLLKG